MDLIIKAVAVLALMIAVGFLTVFARRRNYEGVRRHYTTRRTRVPVAPSGQGPSEIPSVERRSGAPRAGHDGEC